MDHFVLHSEYQPTGDQPAAIEDLVRGFREGNQFQTLLGVTGSGKTFTMANVIAALNKPALIISHNKTLAGQLYGEMKEFFPENAVEYFVSYYDYYQPEAYVPSSDTYIAKDSAINDEIDKLRLSATASLAERRDVVVVASVSCIYGLGSPEEFKGMSISLRPGMSRDRDEVIRDLISIQYTRNDMALDRCNFRVRGDTLELYPAQGGDYLIRLEWFGDEIDRICEVDQLTGRLHATLEHVMIYPASHYVVPQEKINRACDNIEQELKERILYFKGEDKLLEAQRISERTNFDIEMMRETGFCSGIENYSRHLNFMKPGEPPLTLMDFFDRDFNHLPLFNEHPHSETRPAKPDNYAQMLEIAETLSAGFPHVRIDLYSLSDGRILFGEYTFYPSGGMNQFEPRAWDYTIGSWFTLPEPYAESSSK